MSAINGKRIQEVPELEFTEEGRAAIRPDQLIVLGGNHRRKAVQRYVDKLKKDIRGEEAQLKGKSSEAVEEVDTIRTRIRELREDVKQACMWAVRIYDLGVLYCVTS
jgi:hypothetical protein